MVEKIYLENGACDCLSLYGHLDLNTFRVRLCPHEVCVDEFDFGQSLEPLQAEGHQLTGLEAAHNPVGGRVQVSVKARFVSKFTFIFNNDQFLLYSKS